MRNITFSAHEELIRKAREIAKMENTTLNERFREWLKRYVGQEHQSDRFQILMENLSYADSGGPFSRDELN